MGNETLVRVTADASGYTSEMDKAKRSAEAFLTSQDAAARRTQAAQAAITESVANGSDASTRKVNAFMQALTKQAETAGKTRAELLELQAAQLGVSNSAQQYIDQIKKAGASTKQASDAMDHLNFSTVGARRELLVLAHEASQGNWTKFGGSLMVLGERTDAMGLIFSATGATIAAVTAIVGAFAIAAIQGAAESENMAKSLIMTGDYAGVTAGQLHMMAEQIGASTGSYASASEAMLMLASSGKFTSSEIGMIGQSAVRMKDVTGQAIEETVKQFEKLADEPVKASAKLNEQYHYLTLAVFEQIDALVKQGDKQEAAILAEKSYSDALSQRTAEIQANQGLIAKGWHAIASGASAAWDAMLGIGRKATIEETIGALQATIARDQQTAKNSPFFANANKDKMQADQDRLASLSRTLIRASDNATAESESKQKDAGQISARLWMDSFDKEFATKSQKRAAEIKEFTAKATALNFTPEQIASGTANINEKYKDKAGPKPKAYTDDAATRFIQSLRDQDAATRAALDSSDKLTGAEKQQAEFLQKIADLKGKSILTAEQKSLLANQDAIKAQLTHNVADERALKIKQDIQKVEEQSAQINAQIASYQASQREQYQRQLDAFGMGAEAQKNVAAVKSVYKEYEKLQQQLDNGTPKSQIGSSAYLDEKAKIQAQLQASLKDYDDYYAALKAKQADWSNGASQAFANYRDSAANISQQTEALFTNSFKGMEDALVQFVSTGKLSFTSLANSVIAEIDRILIKKQMAKLYDLASSGGSTGMGLIGTAMNMMGMDLSGATQGASAMSAMDGANGFSLAGGFSQGATDMAAMNGAGGFSLMAGFAGGGDPPLNVPSMVGEKGPELFIPRGAGTIIPNDQLRNSNSSQSDQSDRPANITVHVHGNSNAPDVRRAAGQGAREALQAFSGAQRYA